MDDSAEGSDLVSLELSVVDGLEADPVPGTEEGGVDSLEGDAGLSALVSGGGARVASEGRRSVVKGRRPPRCTWDDESTAIGGVRPRGRGRRTEGQGNARSQGQDPNQLPGNHLA